LSQRRTKLIHRGLRCLSDLRTNYPGMRVASEGGWCGAVTAGGSLFSGLGAVAALAFAVATLTASPASGYAPQDPLGQAHLCGAIGAAGDEGQVACRGQRTTFQAGEDVCLLVRFKDPRAHRRYRAIAYRNDREQRRFTSEPRSSWRSKGGDVWTHCEKNVALPGDWRFEVFVDRGRGGFEKLSSARFTVEADALYRFVDAASCSFLGTPAADGSIACIGKTERFLVGEPAHLWIKLADVTTDYRFLAKTYRDDVLVGRRQTHWRHADNEQKHAYFVPSEYSTAPGRYRTEFFIDTGHGFRLVAERSFVVEVLSPVHGSFEHQCDWPADPDVWSFCKHRRNRSRGVARADDTRAWDVNLPRYADAGKPVYPVAPGRVVRYGNDVEPGDGKTAGVLIEHRTPGGERWWSGYLHMQRGSIKMKVGQWVNTDTQVGRIGRTGASNSHLHVAVYTGKNVTGGLRSMEVAFRPRDAADGRPVVVAKRRGQERDVLR
jgi:hypothetical protein